MTIFQCPRCLHKFNKRAHYSYHIKKTSLCDKINDIIPTKNNYIELEEKFNCCFCHTELFTKYTLTRHQNNCEYNPQSIKSQQNIKNSQNIENSFNNIENSFNTNINNNNTNISLSVNDFKDTNTDYITPEKSMSYIKTCMKAIPNLVRDVHFNPKHPENHNMYISNNKLKIAKYKNNGRWYIADDSNEFIKDLIIDFHNDILREHWEDSEHFEQNVKLKKIYDKYEEVTKEAGAQDIIKKVIYAMMYNEKDMILETDRKLKEQVKQKKQKKL